MKALDLLLVLNKIIFQKCCSPCNKNIIKKEFNIDVDGEKNINKKENNEINEMKKVENFTLRKSEMSKNDQQNRESKIIINHLII